MDETETQKVRITRSYEVIKCPNFYSSFVPLNPQGLFIFLHHTAIKSTVPHSFGLVPCLISKQINPHSYGLTTLGKHRHDNSRKTCSNIWASIGTGHCAMHLLVSSQLVVQIGEGWEKPNWYWNHNAQKAGRSLWPEFNGSVNC